MSWLARLKKADAAGALSHPASHADVLENLRKPMMLAANDPTSSEQHDLESAAPELPADPDAWRELAQAYYRHHFACHVCIAAGRGTRYGLRCGVGVALWQAYDDSFVRTREKCHFTSWVRY